MGLRATRQEKLVLRDHTDAVRVVAFSPDGKVFASGRTTGPSASGMPSRANPRPGVPRALTSVAFSPDGKIIQSTGGNFFCPSL